MPEASFPVERAGGVAVVAAPEEIDITNAAGLRAALLQAAARGNGTLVVDMSRTQFCDSAALTEVWDLGPCQALAWGSYGETVVPAGRRR